MAFVKRWKADGHLSAVMKDQGAIRAREVLERKANEHNAKLAFYAEWKLKHHLLPPSTLVTATPTVPQAHTSAPHSDWDCRSDTMTAGCGMCVVTLSFF